MKIILRTTIVRVGFSLDLQGPPGSDFALNFFAIGSDGYQLGGSLQGVLDGDGRFIHLEESPFPLMDVGVSNIHIGHAVGIPAEQVVAGASLPADLPFDWLDQFEGRRIPSGDVKLGLEIDS